MRGDLRAHAAALLVLLAAVAASAAPAHAGFVTGIGAARTAHLADPSNGLQVAVEVPEVFDGYAGATYSFALSGSPSTAPQTYVVEVAVSPDDPDTRAAWNASASVASGASNATAKVTIPPDAIKGTLANAPFRVTLRAANGTALDETDLSVDLRYRAPPADGGLLQLAIASASFWGLVFLYAVHLQKTQGKLRARADALERSIEAQPKEGRGRGEER